MWHGGHDPASMRPPDLPGGNARVFSLFNSLANCCFNEAAGFTRRKPLNVIRDIYTQAALQ